MKLAMPTLLPHSRVRLFASFALLAACAPSLLATPIEELLRVAPPDAAFVLVVQDARGHVAKLRESPFAAWFPTTPFGKQILASPDVQKLHDAVQRICEQAGITPEELVNDFLGDAVVFAFHPSPDGNPAEERGLFLVRPAKMDKFTAFLEKVNLLQIASGEVKEVKLHAHMEQAYFERLKTGQPAEFYCLRGDTFAFSSVEEEIRGFIERDKRLPTVAATKPPLCETMTKLAVDRAAGVLLVNPRTLDARMKAKASRGKPEEKAFLGWFSPYWQSLDAAALFLNIEKDVEAGLALRLKEGAAGLFGPIPTTASRLWSVMPKDAIFVMAGQQKASDFFDSIGKLLPEEGRKAIRGVAEQTLAPVIGRDKLPLVIDSLGPDWGFWLVPPPQGGLLPVPVFALEVQTAGKQGAEAAKAVTGTVDYFFQYLRVVYNTGHTDQIDLTDEADGTATIKSLTGEKSFPPHVRPSFSLKESFLLFASDPDAIRRFRKPGAVTAGAELPLMKFSAVTARAYLQAHSEPLAKYLAERFGTTVPEAARGIQNLVDGLEPFEKVDAFTRMKGQTRHVAARITLTKPLAK